MKIGLIILFLVVGLIIGASIGMIVGQQMAIGVISDVIGDFTENIEVDTVNWNLNSTEISVALKEIIEDFEK